jgi:hypothetical protein
MKTNIVTMMTLGVISVAEAIHIKEDSMNQVEADPEYIFPYYDHDSDSGPD